MKINKITANVLKANGFEWTITPEQEERLFCIAKSEVIGTEKSWVWADEDSNFISISFPEYPDGGMIDICGEKRRLAMNWNEDEDAPSVNELKDCLRMCGLDVGDFKIK